MLFQLDLLVKIAPYRGMDLVAIAFQIVLNGKGPMKSFSRLAALTIAILMAMTLANFQQVAAQDTGDVSDTYDDLAELDGLVSGVIRTFNVDYNALIEELASPASADDLATPASPDAVELPGGLLLFTAGVLQFDSEESAAAALEQARSEVVADDEGTEIEVDGLEGPTAAFTFVEENESGSAGGTTIVTQDGDQLVVVLSAGVEIDTEELATGIAIDIVGAEAGDSEAEFHEDGTSSGGLWDKLPAADDEALESLPEVTDIELVPVQDS